MGRIDELIAELCPDGVEYKALSEVATITRGGSLQKKDFTESGFPCIHYGQIYTKYGLFAEKTFTFIDEGKAKKQRKAQPGDIVMAVTSENIDDICKCVVWLGKTEVAVSGHTAIIHHNQNSKFLAYYFHSSLFFAQKRKLAHGTKVMEVTPDHLGNIKIPVPPLEVQREIVRVLDHFTLLSAELSAELKARKKQYEYYLDTFFKEQSDCLIPLNQVGKLTRGKRFVHADAVEEGVPCIHYGELYTYYGTHADTVKSHIREELRGKMRYAHKGDVIIVGAGENNIDIGVGVSWEGDYDVAVHDACYTLVHNQNSRYISYYLRSHMYHDQIKKYVSSGKICAISAEGIGKALIPIPSLKKQEEIVSILDRFDLLCNGISEGIPAEIETRKKQYEYYRDKLMTFEDD